MTMADEMTDTFSGEEEKTMYHMGFSYMNRINQLLYYANESFRVDNVREQHKALMNIFKELFPMMNPKETEEQDKYIALSEKRMETFDNSYNNYVMTLSHNRPKNLPFYTPKEVSQFMFKWELSLRKIINRMGMLMPKAEDPRFAMMG